jgi:hypothetical protein
LNVDSDRAPAVGASTAAASAATMPININLRM